MLEDDFLCFGFFFLCNITTTTCFAPAFTVMLLYVWCCCMLNKLYLIIIIRNSGNKSCVCMCVCSIEVREYRKDKTRKHQFHRHQLLGYSSNIHVLHDMRIQHNFSIKRNLCLLQNSSLFYQKKRTKIKFNEIFMFRNVSTFFFFFVMFSLHKISDIFYSFT